jgi:hypothetical protein
MRLVMCAHRGLVFGVVADPAIHCIDAVHRFGETNLRQDGMDGFFKSHVCNDICRELGLVKPSVGVAGGGGGAARA